MEAVEEYEAAKKISPCMHPMAYPREKQPTSTSNAITRKSHKRQG
jgi:hypothetical protein